MKSHAVLAAVARRQAGAFSVEQANAAGFTSQQRRDELACGRWEHQHRGVYAIAGTAGTFERRLWAGHLALGRKAVVGSRSSLWLWGVFDEPALAEFVVPPGRSGRVQGVLVHWQPLPGADLTRYRGLPVTTPARSLLDAAAVLTRQQLEDAYDAAASRRLITAAGMLAQLERSARSGRPGSAALRKVLLAQGVGTDRSPSYLEAKALRLFRRAGLPEPRVELTWGSYGQFRLDFIWVEFGLVVEVDGWDCHSSPRARQHDLSRRNQIVLGDLRPLVYTYTDIVRRGARVIAEVCEAMATFGQHGLQSR